MKTVLVCLFALAALAIFGGEAFTHYVEGAPLSFVMLGAAGVLAWLAAYLADPPDTERIGAALLAKIAAVKAALAGGSPPAGAP